MGQEAAVGVSPVAHSRLKNKALKHKQNKARFFLALLLPLGAQSQGEEIFVRLLLFSFRQSAFVVGNFVSHGMIEWKQSKFHLVHMIPVSVRLKELQRMRRENPRSTCAFSQETIKKGCNLQRKQRCLMRGEGGRGRKKKRKAGFTNLVSDRATTRLDRLRRVQAGVGPQWLNRQGAECCCTPSPGCIRAG